MQKTLHKADSRGKVNHGWLKANHSFSFGNYHNPERMNFGALRVLNDDFIDGGGGFGMHPHKNMEIITIPFSGKLEHKDSIGNNGIISKGDIQVMSAGSGIVHSEFNQSATDSVELLQIWVLPNKNGVTPRYEQITLNEEDRKNKWQQIISPNIHEEGIWIHQNAWFHLGDFDANQTISYSLKKKNNGVYLFLISGQLILDGIVLDKRDAIGIWEIEDFQLITKTNAEILIIEVPMNI